LRLLRLAKLARVVRVQRFFRRWENLLSINYSTLKLCFFVALTLVVAHWIACGLFLITSFEPHMVRQPTCFIIIIFPRTVPAPAIDLWVGSTCDCQAKHICWLIGCVRLRCVLARQWTWLNAYNETSRNGALMAPYKIYFVALYWAIMTMCALAKPPFRCCELGLLLLPFLYVALVPRRRLETNQL